MHRHDLPESDVKHKISGSMHTAQTSVFEKDKAYARQILDTLQAGPQHPFPTSTLLLTMHADTMRLDVSSDEDDAEDQDQFTISGEDDEDMEEHDDLLDSDEEDDVDVSFLLHPLLFCIAVVVRSGSQAHIRTPSLLLVWILTIDSTAGQHIGTMHSNLQFPDHQLPSTDLQATEATLFIWRSSFSTTACWSAGQRIVAIGSNLPLSGPQVF